MSDYAEIKRKAKSDKWRAYNRREEHHVLQWVVGGLAGIFTVAAIAAQIYIKVSR